MAIFVLNGRPRGFTHVDFNSDETIRNTFEKSRYKLDGRELRIARVNIPPNNNKGVFGEYSYIKMKIKKWRNWYQ